MSEIKADRKYYIDNLRWACILLLIPFHTAMAWNSWGEGNYIWFHESRILSSFIISISPWYMALLFVLAGVSTRIAFKKRTYKAFIQERLTKLFLPLITGMVTVVALITYYADQYHNAYQGSFLSHYTVFFTKLNDLTGYDGGWTPAHLWFLLYLFIISVLCLGIIALQRKFLPKLSFENMKLGWLVSLAVLLPPANLILNLGGKSIGQYTLLYLIGYYIISEDKILDKIIKYRFLFLAAMLITEPVYIYLFLWAGKADGTLCWVAMYLTCWFGILALLGFAKIGFNQNNKLTRYLTQRSFSIYLFHFLWVVLFQFYLSKVTGNTVVIVLTTVSGSLIMTLVTCEVIRRIPVVRFLFGIKRI